MIIPAVYSIYISRNMGLTATSSPPPPCLA